MAAALASPSGSFVEAKLRPPRHPDWCPVRLNKECCVSLEAIICSFSAPISEEHAWAVIYECTQCLKRLCSTSRPCIYVVTNVADIFVHKEGRVHESTFLKATNALGSRRQTATSDEKVLVELGQTIYTALDYGLKPHEERALTPGLENLLARLLSIDASPVRNDDVATEDDEGIEQDHVDEEEVLPSTSSSTSVSQKNLMSVLSLCENHLSVGSEAETHYRNVCRALVFEALELSSFLERTWEPDIHTEELRELAVRDWAHLWIQTMNELRHGVKLKKTNYSKTPIEYALTPYEMLMDDIRSQRYKLNKVMVDGELPLRVKKDAHDIILDFIRSRPPLKPASIRQLAPVKRSSTPQELLMMSIRSGEGREALRKTPGPPIPKNTILLEVSSGKLLMEPPIVVEDQGGAPLRISSTDSHLAPRVVVACGLNTSFQGYAGKTGTGSHSTYKGRPLPAQRSHSMSMGIQRPLSMSFLAASSNKRIIHPDPLFAFDPDDESEDTDDEGDDDVDDTSNVWRRTTGRKTAIATSQYHVSANKTSPFKVKPPSYKDHLMRSASFRSLKGTARKWSCATSISPRQEGSSSLDYSNTPGSSSKFDSLTGCSNSPEKTVNLSHDEIVHIRSVLNRAKLEAMTYDDGLKNDLEKAKVCFHCTRVRFGLFNWSYTCRLCQHSFCSSCTSKIKLDSNFFSHVPLLALTPRSWQQKKEDRMDDGPHRNAAALIKESLPKRMNDGSFQLPAADYKKRVSFSLIPQQQQHQEDPKSKAAPKARLRRSSTLGRVDTHAQAQALRRPLASNVMVENKKMEQVYLCIECKDVIDRVSKEGAHFFDRTLSLNKDEEEEEEDNLHAQLNYLNEHDDSDDDDDDNDDDDDDLDHPSHAQSLKEQRLTKPLVFR